MNAQLTIGTYGEVSSLTVVPSSREVWEIAEVGPIWCDRCGIESSGNYCDRREVWVPECCWSLCEDCGYYETDFCSCCEHCTDCCSCWFCNGCSESVHVDASQCGTCQQCEYCCSCSYCYGCGNVTKPRNVCSDCDYCAGCCSCSDYDEDGCCSCSDCRAERNQNSGPALVPGWVTRGDAGPTADDMAAVEPLSDFTATAAPVPMMADFYLSEWCALVSSDAAVRRDARTLQSAIVAACDGAFREYVFAAIGGELRHHRNVDLAGGRSTAWDYWRAMAVSGDRVQLIRDAVALFGCDTWMGGYGGRPWQVAAETLLAREEGTLDARTFVDRVFSLQHNSGSLLNKVSWTGGDAYYCKVIGNAHAARTTVVDVLWSHASEDGRDLLVRTDLRSPLVTDGQRVDIAYALENDGPRNVADWTAATWLVPAPASTGPDTYGAAVAEQEQYAAAVSYVAAMVRDGGCWWSQCSDESDWSYNARLHAAVERRMA